MANRKGKTIEDRAKQAEATGARLPAPKQALRDSLIVRRKAQGWEVAVIAAEAGVSARTVHRVLAERTSVGEALVDRDPIDVVKQMVMQCQQDAEDFEELALAYADVNPPVALGAKKGAMQARRELVLLLQATGRLPRDLGYLADLADLRSLAEEMVTVVRKFQRGDATAEEVVATFKQAIGVGRPQPAPDSNGRVASPESRVDREKGSA